MRFSGIIGVLALLFTSAGVMEARGTTAQDALGELKSLMKREVDERGLAGFSSEGGRNEEKRMMLQQVAQIRAQIARGNSSYAQEMLSRVAAVFTSEAVNVAVDKAQAQLQQEQKNRDADYVKSTEDVFAAALTRALKAKSAAEIDPLLKNVGDLQARSVVGGERSAEVQRQMNRIQNGLEFIRRWQDYLFAQERGSTMTAQGLAREMASNSSFNDFMARSELLARAASRGGAPKSMAFQEFVPLYKQAILAKSAVEVDAVLDAGSALKSRWEAVEETQDHRIAYAMSALTWIQQWQMVLLAAEKGHANEVKTKAFDLLNRSDALAGVPRGLLLQTIDQQVVDAEKRWAAMPDPDLDAIRKLKTLEEMSAFIALHPAPDSSSTNEVVTPISALRQLNQVYLNSKADLPVFTSMRTGGFTNLPEIIALKAELQLYAIPRILNLPPGTTAAPGEGPLRFLNRLIAEAKKRGDWAQAGRASELLEGLAGDSFRLPSDGAAIAARYQKAAQNLTDAGQFMPAVYYYNAALQVGGEGVAAEEIGQALAKIKAEHGADYEEGNKQFLVMGPEAANRMAEMMRMQMGGRGGFPFGSGGSFGQNRRFGPASAGSGNPENPTPAPSPTAKPTPKKKKTAP